MTDSMKEELRKAPFVAVMLDETTDISNVAQMSYVLRYQSAPSYWMIFASIGFHGQLLLAGAFILAWCAQCREDQGIERCSSTEFDDETVHCSDGYITLLTSFDISFWLKTFHAIFSYSDVVFQILQNKGFDMHESVCLQLQEPMISQSVCLQLQEPEEEGGGRGGGGGEERKGRRRGEEEEEEEEEGEEEEEERRKRRRRDEVSCSSLQSIIHLCPVNMKRLH
ncbi:hypothetical protein F7725_028419 [Dissostichus mawsoni]|uniref:Uncharacterized protein n=1 Tax=Dissostichus mawsoni TaxID=36200 RepID=A0A7J5XFV7_DISMA|nr:hypothetical protein F7725_028419 [Dissostichus mawsoni]